MHGHTLPCRPPVGSLPTRPPALSCGVRPPLNSLAVLPLRLCRWRRYPPNQRRRAAPVDAGGWQDALHADVGPGRLELQGRLRAAVRQPCPLRVGDTAAAVRQQLGLQHHVVHRFHWPGLATDRFSVRVGPLQRKNDRRRGSDVRAPAVPPLPHAWGPLVHGFHFFFTARSTFSPCMPPGRTRRTRWA